MTGPLLPWGGVVLVVFGFIEPVNSASPLGGFVGLWTFHKLWQKC